MATKGQKNPNAGRKVFDGKDENLVIQKLEQAWAFDCTDAEAASYADISKAALCEYLKRKPEIAERRAALKERPVLFARKSVIDAINSGDARIALAYLERKRRDEFATKTEHVAQVTADVDLSGVSTDTLKKVQALLDENTKPAGS